MFNLNSKITIGTYVFDFVTDITIKSSWTYLTDICTIIIPKKINFNGKPITNGTNSIFHNGQRVKIELGYNGVYATYFDGYVKTVNPSLPITIECEDLMYIFKTKSFSASFKDTTLLQLVNYIISQYTSSTLWPALTVSKQIPSIDLGKIRLKNVTGAQVWDMLRKDYGINSFIRDGMLYVGLAYYPSLQQTVSYAFEDVIIENDLLFQNASDVKIKLKVVNINTLTNKQTNFEVGDGDGEERTYYVFDMPDSSLATIGNNELPKYKYTGFEGSFTTFLMPQARHQYVCNLSSSAVPERNGNYLIKEVETRFGIDGGRQTITVDQRLS